MEDNLTDVRMAILASGKGSNAAQIIHYFKHHPRIKVSLIASNNKDAGVLAVAHSAQVPVIILEKEKFFRGDAYLDEFLAFRIDVLVLAGFLWKIPPGLIRAYSGRIINIHPALLPHFGGKGMYGIHVHEAVIAAGEKESGISIHEVDEVYDHGRVLFQAKCPVLPTDNAQSLAEKVHHLEYAYYPRQIEQWIGMQNIVKR